MKKNISLAKVESFEVLAPHAQEIVRKEKVVIRVTRPYYSAPKYGVVNSDEDLQPLYKGQPHRGGYVREEYFIVLQITKKTAQKNESWGSPEDYFYCGSFESHTLIDVCQWADGRFFLGENMHKSWCNSQRWKPQIQDKKLRRFEISSGEEGCMEKYNLILGEEKKARATRYKELSALVAEKYGNEVVRLVSKKKGQVLGMLQYLAEADSSAEAKKMVAAATTADELKNLLQLEAAKVSPSKAYKVAQKAYAWAYLENAFPGVKWEGYFDEALGAVKIYASLSGVGPNVSDLANSWGARLKKRK